MASSILLYGATGFSGGLIAAELAARCAATPDCDLIVAGRDAAKVAALAQALGVEWKAFGIDDATALAEGFHGVRVVINAAGPFLDPLISSAALARAAVAARAHYTDIVGDASVYLGLQLVGPAAAAAGVALVPAGGAWAAGSNVLLDHALATLRPVRHGPLGAVRIAMSRIVTPSRGSAAAVLGALRQDVLVVRRGAGGERLICRVPVGKLERTFDFGPAGAPRPAQASAASLIDTVAAMPLLDYHSYAVDTLETYVEADALRRLGYLVGAAVSPWLGIAAVQAVARAPLALLAAGPDAATRAAEPNAIVLQIDDAESTPLIDWLWQTPNVYDLTARLVAELAVALTTTKRTGFTVPARIVPAADIVDPAVPVAGFAFTRRLG